MISVRRNTHIPSVEESNCCSAVSKWWRTASACPIKTASASAPPSTMRRLLSCVVVRIIGYHGGLVEIVSRRRRWRLLPLQSLGAPGILRRDRPFAPGPRQIEDRKQVAHSQNRGSGARHHVQSMKLGCVCMIAARHPQVSQQELREE